MLKRDICSRIILSYCPNYETKRQIFNRSIQKYPSAIVYCENKEDVKKAVCSAVSNAELYNFLAGYGYPFPSGTCPTVNAVGLTQGGGWGHSARMFGLSCDLLTEAELVDAGGNFIVADKNSHSDLFGR